MKFIPALFLTKQKLVNNCAYPSYLGKWKIFGQIFVPSTPSKKSDFVSYFIGATEMQTSKIAHSR